MKIVFQYESDKEREDFLLTLASPEAEKLSLDELEAELTDKILDSLGQQYLRSLRSKHRAERKLDLIRLKKFRGNPKEALEAALEEKKGKK